MTSPFPAVPSTTRDGYMSVEVVRKEVSIVQIGEAVVYLDENRKQFDALITNVFDTGRPDLYPNPTVNLLYVDDDPAREDQYGRQIQRPSSVQHISAFSGGNQQLAGRVWKRREE